MCMTVNTVTILIQAILVRGPQHTNNWPGSPFYLAHLPDSTLGRLAESAAMTWRIPESGHLEAWA